MSEPQRERLARELLAYEENMRGFAALRDEHAALLAERDAAVAERDEHLRARKHFALKASELRGERDAAVARTQLLTEALDEAITMFRRADLGATAIYLERKRVAALAAVGEAEEPEKEEEG